MERMQLSFSLFYQVVVKGNMTLPQYDAVSMLLYGELRESAKVFLDDSLVSNYANGKKLLIIRLHVTFTIVV